MITVQNLHLTNKEGQEVSKPLLFQHCPNNFTKLTTEVDGKECFLTYIGAKELVPVASQKANTNHKKMEEKLGISSTSYKMDLDLNSNEILVLRKRAVKIFDDSALLFKFRVPDERLTIESINKYTDTTNIRYLKLSKDRKECLVFVTFRTLLMIKKDKGVVSPQFINSKLDGSIQIVMQFENNGPKVYENVSPIIHFCECVDKDNDNIKSIPVKTFNQMFSNMVITEKGFDLLTGFNSIKEELNSIEEINKLRLMNSVDKSKINEIYGIHLRQESIFHIIQELKRIKGLKYRFFNIPIDGHMELIMSHGLLESKYKQDTRISNNSHYIKDGVKLIIPANKRDMLRDYPYNPIEKTRREIGKLYSGSMMSKISK